MKNNNNNNNISLVVTVLAVAVLLLSIIGFGVTVNKIGEFKKTFTGYASSGSGYVNLTILSSISINVSNYSINWGGGYVNNPLYSNATLFTNATYSAGNVTGGNWSGTGVQGFTIDNIGNVVASVNISSGKNAADMFASRSSTNQAYKWNATIAKTNSCPNITATWHNNVWADVAKSGTAPYRPCTHFNFTSGSNTLNLDVYLIVPYDAANIGWITDTITITAVATS
jgi:hypothetical protein